MPPKSTPFVQCECKTAEGKLCMNTGSHVNSDGRNVCGTHVKNCKGGFASNAELTANRDNFLAHRAAKSETALGLSRFKTTIEDRLAAARAGSEDPESARAARAALIHATSVPQSIAQFQRRQPTDRKRVATQQQKQRLEMLKKFAAGPPKPEPPKPKPKPKGN